jgi:multicomponent Na+:H+ antiporter subunit C
MLAGLYVIITSINRLRKLLGLAMFQLSAMLFYISMGKVKGGIIPILKCLEFEKCPELYSNPLPHILMLTAIVVGAATMAVGIAIVFRIKEETGSAED